ncbi:MAG: LemA family protein [Candidatus Omnitrophica bacterium]|nr:LemA family protein [Candidatus Omnitrophota bacterium]MDD5080577.1 LemA family protein [Candidatus Omnitrophota bacterium]MDD5441072.1 LemA family protein [Candidatus Omnitrophota bacterium]
MGFVIFIVLLAGICVLLYNSVIGKKNQVDNAFASIDAMLKKRYDLIPSLVASVKQYMLHESSILTEITETRSRAMSGNLSADDRVDLDNKITKMLGGIMVAVENYPDLKANQNFLQLQRALNEVEEQISAARRAYNASVTDFNNACEMLPTNIIAGMLNLKRRKVFEITEIERKNIDVKGLFNN